MATEASPLAAVEPVVAAAPEPVATPAPVESPAAPREDRDVIREAVSKILPVGEDGQLLKPGETPKPVEAAPIAAKTPEEIEAEKIAAGVTETPEAKAAREKVEADKVATAKPAEVDPLDKLGPLPAEKLAQVLTEKPELATALEAAGISKDVLFETARQAAITSQFTEIFPTPDAAKFAQESAGHFYEIEEGFPAIQTIDDYDTFVMNTMVKMSALTDPATGEPLKNPDGTLQTDGSVERFQKLSVDFDAREARKNIPQILEQIRKLPEGQDRKDKEDYFNNLLGAIDYYQEFRDNGYKMPGPKQEITELSPELKAKVDLADKTLLEARQRETANQQKEVEIFENNVYDDATKFTNDLISEALNRSSLDDKLKPKAAKEIYDAIGESLLSNKEYGRLSASYRAKGLTEDTRQKLAAHNNTTIKSLYGKIVQKVLAEYGATQIAASDARLNKIAAQTTTANIHPSSTSSAAAKGPQALTDQQINEQVTKSAKDAGKELDIGWQIQERLRLSGKLATA